MSVLKRQRGLTVLEIALGILIMTLILPGIVGTTILTLKKASQDSAELASGNGLQLARYWLTRDMNSASNYVAGSGTTYGTLYWYDHTGVYGTPTPTPAPTAVVKTSESDFEAYGATLVNLDTVTIPGDMFLPDGGTPGTSFSSNVGPPGSLGAGSLAIQRPNGHFLIIQGNTQTNNYDYDPSTNSFTTNTSLSGYVGAGSLAIRRSVDGNFFIARGGASTGSYVYDPVANSFTAGPTFPNAVADGSVVIPDTDGTHLIFNGNFGTSTTIYTPGASGSGGTLSAGPASPIGMGAGAHALLRPDGTYLVIAGGSTQNTRIYNPSTKTFSGVAGPSTGAGVGAGAHSLQRPDGTYLVVCGGKSNNTVIYNPTSNSFTAGPTIPGASSVNIGALSFQLADGTWMIVESGTATSIYNPTANTMTTGPALGTSFGAGALTIQRPNDGMYLVIQSSGATSGQLFNGGFYMNGSYTSDAISPDGLSSWTTIEWDKTPDVTLNVYVRTAKTRFDLDYATYRSVAASGDSIGAGSGEVWLQVKISYSRVIPLYPNAYTDVWPGSGNTFYDRYFQKPDVQEIRLKYLVLSTPPATSTDVVKTTEADFEASGSTRVNLDTSTVPGDMLLNIKGTPAASFTSASGPPATLGSGAHAIQRPNGAYIVFLGNGKSTNYDYDGTTFTTRTDLPSSVGSGGFSFKRPDGEFLVVGGNSKSATFVYDPNTDSFVSGPNVTSNASDGALAIPNADGTYLIVLGNRSSNASIYTPTGGPGGIGTMATGPSVGVNVGAGAQAILRPDGNYLLIAGKNSPSTLLYNTATQTFSSGPNTGTNINSGAFSVQMSASLFLVVAGGGSNNTVVYNTSTNSFSTGPTVAGASSVNDGAHAFQRADGTWMIIKANGSNATAIYNPVANTMSAGPSLVTNYSTGSISIQRSDGTYVTIDSSGASSASVYNAGLNMSGQYVSEGLRPTQIDNWTTIQWDKTATNTITMSVRGATSQSGLSSATYQVISNSGDSMGMTSAKKWLQVKADFAVSVPSYPGVYTSIWPGSATTFYTRTFPQPDLQEIRIYYQYIPKNESFPFTVRYYYDPTLKTVMREETQAGNIVSTTQVASNVLNQGDVAFTYDSAENKLTVSITSTTQEAPAIGNVDQSATIIGYLRPNTESTVVPP